MRWVRIVLGCFTTLLSAVYLDAQTDDPNARPPVTKADINIIKRGAEILNSPAKWDRASTECSADAKTLSLICAFEQAEKEVAGSSTDGAAIRAARAMISELDPSRKYKSRLVDYHADPSVSSRTSKTFSADWKSDLPLAWPNKLAWPSNDGNYDLQTKITPRPTAPPHPPNSPRA
jgi:hypothetical protein